MPPTDSTTSSPKPASDASNQEAGLAAASELEQLRQTSGPAAAADKLRSEYLASAQNPAKDAANLTTLDYEMTRLRTDSVRGDSTLLDCATLWGIDLLGSQGGIDQASLDRMATTGKAQDGDTNLDPYGQAMAAELDQNFRALSGFGHTALNGMDSPQLTLSDLSESLAVDERIRTYKPAPPPPTLWQEIKGLL